MEQRINVLEKGKKAMETLYGIGGYLRKSPLGEDLLDLVHFRISQINGCAFCLDMHSKDLRARGESEQRLYGLSAWRDTPYYTDRERAALAWAEAVNRCDVPDEVYLEAKKQFSEEELIDLTLGITAINTYNRINIAFRTVPGGYEVGQFA
ncbi:carboxymuconolactone decarboxylase family protein [Compostibacter hankyongensis]